VDILKLEALVGDGVDWLIFSDWARILSVWCLVCTAYQPIPDITAIIIKMSSDSKIAKPF